MCIYQLTNRSHQQRWIGQKNRQLQKHKQDHPLWIWWHWVRWIRRCRSNRSLVQMVMGTFLDTCPELGGKWKSSSWWLWLELWRKWVNPTEGLGEILRERVPSFVMNLEALSGPQFFCRVKLPWNLLFLSACVCDGRRECFNYKGIFGWESCPQVWEIQSPTLNFLF